MASILETRFGGIIRSGKHEENGECCILEYESVLRQIPWTDSPEAVRCFDIRILNDSYWSCDELRTKWMIALLDAIRGSLDWPIEKQKSFITGVILRTIQEIISELPNLSEEIRQQCRNCRNLEQAARAAARAADVAAAADAAAAAAARAAYAVANAAARAADVAAAVAARAARAAADVADAAANADVADAAARAAANAACAAANADAVLIKVCIIWIEEANK